jgi:hypothetical protein
MYSGQPAGQPGVDHRHVPEDGEHQHLVLATTFGGTLPPRWTTPHTGDCFCHAWARAADSNDELPVSRGYLPTTRSWRRPPTRVHPSRHGDPQGRLAT